MRALVLSVSVVAVLLVGCSKPAGHRETLDAKTVRLAPPPAGQTDASAVNPSDSKPVEAAPAPSPSAPMLAYAYAYGIEAPSGRLPGLVARHQAACAAAGAAVCQVTGSTLERQGKDQLRASLALRATPAWLTRFRDGLDRDADAAGGRVTQANVTSEDLSRQVTDTEAAIRAQTTLRDRLQALLASHPGKVADLVEAETALAKVQGELDATRSEMAMMRQRLDSSTLTLDYQSAGVLGSDGAWAPLSRAIGQVAETFSTALAVMVTCAAFLAPWAVVIGGGLWLFRGPLARVKWPWRRGPRPPG